MQWPVLVCAITVRMEGGCQHGGEGDAMACVDGACHGSVNGKGNVSNQLKPVAIREVRSTCTPSTMPLERNPLMSAKCDRWPRGIRTVHPQYVTGVAQSSVHTQAACRCRWMQCPSVFRRNEQRQLVRK
jgi:hypothetical protein